MSLGLFFNKTSELSIHNFIQIIIVYFEDVGIYYFIT